MTESKPAHQPETCPRCTGGVDRHAELLVLLCEARERFGGADSLTARIDAALGTRAPAEETDNELERYRACLLRIAADYYHDRHAIWAMEVLNPPRVVGSKRDQWWTL